MIHFNYIVLVINTNDPKACHHMLCAYPKGFILADAPLKVLLHVRLFFVLCFYAIC